VSNELERIKEWVDSLRQDIETVKTVVANEAVDDDARKFAAAALNYLVSRMDLVPDWNQDIGVIDDVLVLRVTFDLASAYGLDEDLDAATLVDVGRLTNDVEAIERFLGPELYARLRKHCARLSEEAVRGRTPEAIVGDPEARAALYAEVDDELLRLPAASFGNPEAVAVSFKAYLAHKLS
jgi:uncharacterized membrane protein YkvA (DUF1232 family)